MNGEKLVTHIETILKGAAPTPLSWKEYLEDTKDLPKPTGEQMKRVKSEIEASTLLSRTAKTGWKIVPFLSGRDLGEKEGSEEQKKKYGYLTYIVVNEDGKLVHEKGSADLSKVLPEQLLKNAVTIEVPVFKGLEVRTDTLSFTEGSDLEKSLKSV